MTDNATPANREATPDGKTIDTLMKVYDVLRMWNIQDQETGSNGFDIYESRHLASTIRAHMLELARAGALFGAEQ